jgi:cytochrome o ubiquinol oxidase subunit II
MQFRFYGMSTGDFDQWTQKLKSAGNALDRDAYKQLERPSENVPVSYYSSVAPDLYHAIVNLCVDTGKMCQDEMMRIDAKGGLGLEGINNLVPLTYDKFVRRGSVFGPQPSYVASLCERPKTGELSFWNEDSLPLRDMSPVHGAGLPPPGTASAPLSSSSPL